MVSRDLAISRAVVSYAVSPRTRYEHMLLWRDLKKSALPTLRRSESARSEETSQREGCRATIKKLISRARIRAQWQIYRFQPSRAPSSSTGRILKAEGAPTTRTECTSNRTSTVYALRLQPFRFLSTPPCPTALLLSRHRIFTFTTRRRSPLRFT